MRLIDITGQRFGCLVVLQLARVPGSQRSRWLCRCDCGRLRYCTGGLLRDGNNRYCRATCTKKRESFKGQKFGHLTALEEIGRATHSRGYLWRCECDCGNHINVPTRYLQRQSRTHCGCRDREKYAAVGMKRRLSDKIVLLNRLISYYKNNATKRSLEFTLSAEEFDCITSQPCHYCGQTPNKKISLKGRDIELLYNGVDRKDNRLGYTRDNSLPCCTRCNYMKSSMGYDEFVGVAIQIASNEIRRREKGE